MTIEKRLQRLEAILDARGLDWDHPRVASDHFAEAGKMVSEEPAKEASLGGLPDIRTFAQPNLRWRILEPGEVVQEGDWMNARVNSQEDGPPDGGWLPASSFYFGKDASVSSGLYFSRTVSDEPPEPEYREPVLPADCGKVCEFSDDGNDWTEGKLRGYAGHLWQSVSSEVVGEQYWDHARIKKDA